MRKVLRLPNGRSVCSWVHIHSCSFSLRRFLAEFLIGSVGNQSCSAVSSVRPLGTFSWQMRILWRCSFWRELSPEFLVQVLLPRPPILPISHRQKIGLAESA